MVDDELDGVGVGLGGVGLGVGEVLGIDTVGTVLGVGIELGKNGTARGVGDVLALFSCVELDAVFVAVFAMLLLVGLGGFLACALLFNAVI